MFYNNVHTRIRYIFLVVILVLVIAIARVFYIQVFSYKKLNTLAESLWSRKLPISADRGKIVDRNGRVLADNITTTSLVVIPNQIENKEDAAKKLSEILGSDYKDMLKHVSKKTSIERVHPEGRRLSYEIAEKIDALKIDGVYLVEPDEIYEIEPNINTAVKKGLYSQNVAIVAPYDLAIAYAEVASDNGVNFRLEEEVLTIQNITKGFKVVTNKNKFSCKVVINTIADEIYINENGIVKEKDIEDTINSFKNMSYLLLDDNYENKLERIVTKTFDKDTFVVSTPGLNGGSLVGIKSIEKTSLDDNLNYASKLLKKLNKSNINNLFRESYDKDSIVIDEKKVDKGYISVIGTHYGKVTLAPAIAKMLCDTISSNLNCKLKKNFIDKRREFYRFREMDRNEINEVIKLDKRYGKIICMCNNVSEGEIVDSIRRPLGARTVKGVKRRTGAGFGNCHGAYCNERIIQILARELDKKITDIVDDSKNSNIISGRIKEFKEI